MHAGVVQSLLAVADAQKAGALFERLRPQLGYLQKLLPALEPSVLFAVGDNIFRQCLVDARDVLKQGNARGIQVDADAIHAVLDHAAEALRKLLLIHIMLVLPDTDGLGLDLHKLRQRILQASRDGRRASRADIQLRELLRRQLARRVHARSRLIDDGVRHLLRDLREKLNNDLLRLSRGGSVAERYQLYAEMVDDLFQKRLRLSDLILRLRRIDDYRVQHLARRVHDRELTARAERRVPAEHDLAGDRRLHQ